MACLLDVNVLLAAICEEHPNYQRAFEWIKGKRLAVCPIFFISVFSVLD